MYMKKVNEMKLFDDVEAVRFPEENMIFVTHGGYLCYIYNLKRGNWRKYRNPGFELITVSNYQEVSNEELISAMGGVFPSKETDFLRLCNPEQLWIVELMKLLEEDYPDYMSDYEISNPVNKFLIDSDFCHRSYLKIRELFDNASENHYNNEQTLFRIKELSLAVMGRDIFKKEIGIVDGYYGSSCFRIMPARILDDTDTADPENVAKVVGAEISIEISDVDQYLTPFLYKYFDDELEANKRRVDYWGNDESDENATYITGFEFYNINYYTFEAMENILRDIRDTTSALSSGKETEYIKQIREIVQEQIYDYDANFDSEIELLIDFYNRFLYRMEHMIRVGKEKGYNLISFTGP